MNLPERLELWNALQSFQLGFKDSPQPFITRLCKDTGWDENFAERAIEEYKRFLFLTSVSSHRCTPSDVVDQVWHLHLLYTRSYWEELCPKILKKNLHHEPGNAPTDLIHFQRQYEKTLLTYYEFIGHKPPEDIWGVIN